MPEPGSALHGAEAAVYRPQLADPPETLADDLEHWEFSQPGENRGVAAARLREVREKRLTRLDLSDCDALSSLPSTLPDCLHEVDLSGCKSLLALPVQGAHALHLIPPPHLAAAHGATEVDIGLLPTPDRLRTEAQVPFKRRGKDYLTLLDALARVHRLQGDARLEALPALHGIAHRYREQHPGSGRNAAIDKLCGAIASVILSAHAAADDLPRQRYFDEVRARFELEKIRVPVITHAGQGDVRIEIRMDGPCRLHSAGWQARRSSAASPPVGAMNGRTASSARWSSGSATR
ncbi:membrane-targeted effector domain-containing toxin [Paludibacterium yongneupense]|uniref:membrane-targeted effector domain-containing toxin n=1 Tax=Paludibacterium yongneupense TaxID=400061 RepID=UPI00041DB97C|nr:membrane-targeted effector domain-containing toxin [Paludibacterium yongneupense]